MELKAKTKIFDLLNKLWPGMKNEKDVFQAVNQWTGEPLTYDNGKPIMTPYTRCKLTNEIVNVKSGTCHADHIDGDRTNNTVDFLLSLVGQIKQKVQQLVIKTWLINLLLFYKMLESMTKKLMN